MAKKEHKEPFIVTEEMVEKATSYIPLADKMAWVAVIAKECIEPVELGVLNEQANQTMALPSMYQENTHQKHLYLMQKFLVDYFHIEVSESFTSSDYDEYAQYQPLMQLERLKVECKKKENKNKIFNLLYDYRNLEKYCNNEIHKVVTAYNDGLSRMLAGITIMSDPETVKKMAAELQKTIGEVEVAQNKLADKRTAAKKTETKPTEKK